MDISLKATLQVFSYGVAVADIEYGSNLLKVKILDHLPNSNGEVNTGLELLSAKVKTPKGVVEKSVIFSDYIEAYWLNRNSPRTSAPDIMKGMRVVLWRDADSDVYYWEELDTDKELKTLEHVIFAFSNTNTEDRTNKELSFENCYILEFDTRNKKVGLYTNKNDREPYAFNILLDTAYGSFKIEDDIGDFMLLDVPETLWHIQNRDNTYYKLFKKDIIEHCHGNRTLIVDGDNTETIGGASTITVARNQHIKAGGIGFDTGDFITKASSVGFDTPTATFSGLVVMAGFSAGGAPGAGSPPKGGSGYTGIIDGTLLVTDSVTTPKANISNLTADNIVTTSLNATSATFASHGPH